MLSNTLAVLIVSVFVQSGSAFSPQRIVALEWLPLGVQSEVLQSFESTVSPVAVERLSAYGDPAELDAAIARLEKARPALVFGFGERVCGEVASKLPGVPLLAVSGREDALPKSRSAPAVVIVTEPEPGMVWDVATKLTPKLSALAVLYTEGCEANEKLAAALERDIAKRDRELLRVSVPAGNCRIDSDFEKALDGLRGHEPRLVLYVPDDPNCSRFGNVICRLASERHIVVLGSEAIVGKGCAAALTLDAEALGEQCAEWARELAGGKAKVEVRKAPYRVVVDGRAMAAQGLALSDELKGCSVPLEE